jgi:hypothetical protein
MNSDIARSLIKLWAWSARGGYYRHTSYSMGLLPIPKALVNDTLWSFLNKLLEFPQEAPDLNNVACELLKTYRIWKWLNELKVPQEEEIEEAEEEED